MEPITMILTALVAGAAAGATEAAGQAVKDGYAALKALVVSKFGKQSSVEGALNGVENSPDSKIWQEALKEELAKVQADKDHACIAEGGLQRGFRRTHRFFLAQAGIYVHLVDVPGVVR